jgi:hypothetical protein
MATTLNAGTATGGAVISADTTGILQLQSGPTPTTAVTIDASQNVGIGTTSSGDKLEVLSSTNRLYIRAESTYSSTGSEAGIRLKTTGANGREYLFFNSNTDGSLRFFDLTAVAERMRIDSSGNLLVGTTTAYGKTTLLGTNSSVPLACWNNNGTSGFFTMISFRNNAGTSEIGNVLRTNDNTISFNNTSDYRLKDNITPMTGALAKVDLLKPVTYTWKSDGSAGQGFIAHELQEVVPDAVAGDKDAINEDGSIKPQGIDTSFLVATLTAAIQEQQALITQLQADVAALKGAK